MEVIIEKKDNGQNLPGDKRAKLAAKLGGQIFLIEEGNIPCDVLKARIKYRSYRAVDVKKTEIHTGKEGVSGLQINGDLFFGGKNTKFAGEEGSNKSSSDNNNNNNEKTYVVALDRKTAKQHSIDFNVLQREEIDGIILTLQRARRDIEDIIQADREAAE